MDIRKELIEIAAELALCEKMPSPHHEDWDWPKGMQITSWRKVCQAAFDAESQCKKWANRLRKVADALQQQDSPDTCSECGATINEDGCLFCGGSLDESF